MLKGKKFTQPKRSTPRASKEEQAKERERMVEALAALSGADHQMPAGERPGQGVVGVKSAGEVTALLESSANSRPILL